MVVVAKTVGSPNVFCHTEDNYDQLEFDVDDFSDHDSRTGGMFFLFL